MIKKTKYLSLPFLSGSIAIYLILATYTMFCMTRTIGVAVQQTVQKMISTSRTRGEVIMTLSSRFNSVALLSRFFSFVWTSLHFLSELTGILTLQVMGILMNTLASFNLKKMPNREVVDYIPGQHIGKIFVRAMKKKKERTILILRWGAICIEILFGMTIPFLRQYAGFYEDGSTDFKKTWTMIFSIEHMRTFRDISRLSGGNTNLKRKTLILSLTYTGSSLANEEIRQMLHNPLNYEQSVLTLVSRQYTGSALPITRSILKFDMDAADSSNSIGALYYTYQILSKGGIL
jgi:hypothetical protein